MSLTEEQKQKIQEEEAYRSEVRGELKPKKKGGFFSSLFKFTILIFVLLVLGSTLMLNVARNQLSTGKTLYSSPTPQADTSNLNGNVNFDGTQFVITNYETKDWKSCYAKLNGNYYYPSANNIFEGVKAGEVVTVGVGTFVQKDGTRFNPYTIKPQNIALSCEKRFGYWEWR